MNLSLTTSKLVILLLCSFTVMSQEILPLYEAEIPNSKPAPDTEKSEVNDGILVISNVSRPTLTVYLPEPSKATGQAIIVVPGGGYHIVAAGHEGEDVAKRFNAMGVAAFVLKYRIPNPEWMVNPEIGPLQDAQRAIQLVRMNAKKWNINEKAVGILGFSAGGHLASTAATHFKKSYIPKKKNISLRPDFLILVYPVITFTDDSATHTGSRDNLLGKNASPEKLREYSNELQVTSKTPPTFLVHAKDDPVKVKNTTLFADALSAKGVDSEVLLYETGGHGFGLVNKDFDVQWPDRVWEWMKKLNLK
ncbi:MAG: alpha/beta hydrolase [Chitinophagaceae bacterium]|nr:alpha/beta hydrolase [Chitinophagaceae bacterium]